ncbi:hypothetical protein BB561_006111 [Smittium simulii]|uniref:Elongation factor 2 n=1 Tax=Smittium simulii TaxID=133385 RepID=A0A2T9Y6I1_9FUNG|nr:hypothetical protein BB561_006111 [Smittium simulii]
MHCAILRSPLYSYKHIPSKLFAITQQQRVSLNALCKNTIRRLYGSNADPISLIRNVGIIAHVDAGKTTTTERMLFYSGFIKKIGEVDTGDTVMDYLPAERQRGITINSSAITFGWKDNQINLIDTPGHIDFTIEVERSIRVLDGCITILDGVSGVQAQTLNVWNQSQKYKLPKIIYINKLDREGVFLDRSLAEIAIKLKARTLILQKPLFISEYSSQCDSVRNYIDDLLRKANFNKENNENLPLLLIDWVSMNILCFDTSKGVLDNMYKFKIIKPTDPDDPSTFIWDNAIQIRSEMLEILGEIDQVFLEKFFSKEIDANVELVSEVDIKSAIRRQTVLGAISPVLFGSSFKNYGVQPVLDSAIDYLPSPADRHLQNFGINNNESTKITNKQQNSLISYGKNKANNNITSFDSNDSNLVSLDPNAPLVAFAFKVVVDPKKGPMTYVKIYSGTLCNRSVVVNSSNSGIKERVMRLLQMYSDFPEEVESISCGNIGVIIGCKKTRTGDTLLGLDHKSLVNSKISAKKSKSIATTEENVFESKDFLGDTADSESNLSNNHLKSVGLCLQGINIPPPVFFCSIEPETLTEEKNLKHHLSNMMLEDPSLVISTSTESGQILLSGMGELHLEVVVNRLLNELNVKASVGKMRVSYRESIHKPSSQIFEYEKEVLGKHLKFGMEMTIEPISDLDASDILKNLGYDKGVYALDNNNFLQIENNLHIGSLSQKLKIKSTEKSNNKFDYIETDIYAAASTAIYQGPIFGFPLTKLKITVKNLKFYDLELSSSSAIRMCTRAAFKATITSSDAILLEPVMHVVINLPNEYVGLVISELERGRRATVLSFEDGNYEQDDLNSANNSNHIFTLSNQPTLLNELKDSMSNKEIICQVPLSSMIGFSSVLRKLTAGSGSFTMRIDGYNNVDNRMKENIIKDLRGY